MICGLKLAFRKTVNPSINDSIRSIIKISGRIVSIIVSASVPVLQICTSYCGKAFDRSVFVTSDVVAIRTFFIKSPPVIKITGE